VYVELVYIYVRCDCRRGQISWRQFKARQVSGPRVDQPEGTTRKMFSLSTE
jgi:hypothetical protein